MTWNHRVFVDRTLDEPTYSIREAHYENGVLTTFTADAVAPQAATLDELRITLRLMLDALALPVLDEQTAIGSSLTPSPAPAPPSSGEGFWERDDAIRARVKAVLASRAAIRKDRDR